VTHSFIIPMDRTAFEAARGKLIAAGVSISPSAMSGECGARGVTVSYEFDDGELHIEILKKPMLVPSSMVEARVRTWFAT
jgi:hypothetical protein